MSLRVIVVGGKARRRGIVYAIPRRSNAATGDEGRRIMPRISARRH